MKVPVPALVFVIAACPLLSSPIISTSVYCQSYGAQRITAVSSCEEGGPLNPEGASPSYAAATANASVALQHQPTDWLTVTTQANVNPMDGAAWLYQTGQAPPNMSQAPAYAGASVAVHVDSYTLGDVRPGFLQIQWNSLFLVSYGDVQAIAGFSIQDPLLYNGAFTGSCRGQGFDCAGPSPQQPPIPFELGTAFSIDSFATLNGSSLDGLGYGTDGLLLKFRFLEADGVTLVTSYDDPPPDSAPEPGTWALTAFAGLGILIGSHRKGGVKCQTSLN